MLFPRPPIGTTVRYLRAYRPTHITRRYASEQSPGQGKNSTDIPKVIGIASLAMGTAYYFLRSGSGTKSHHNKDQFFEAEKREASTTAEQSAPEPDRDSQQKVTAPGSNSSGGSWGQPPSTIDAAGARKEPGGAGSISAKQEGLSNTTTDNPFMNEPGKSKKGEGETETAKSKGTISPNRPQA